MVAADAAGTFQLQLKSPCRFQRLSTAVATPAPIGQEGTAIRAGEPAAISRAINRSRKREADWSIARAVTNGAAMAVAAARPQYASHAAVTAGGPSSGSTLYATAGSRA